MADTKISALSAVSAVAGANEFAVNEAGTSKKVTADQLDAFVHMVPSFPAPPSGITIESFPRTIANSATAPTNTSGTLRMSPIMLPKGFTVTNIYFHSGTTALGTGTHGWYALYDSSLNLLRQSTDDTSPTFAASTLKGYALSSAFVTTYAGLHFCGELFTGGTMQTNAGFTVMSTTLQLTAPVLQGASSTGLTGTAPNPAAAITAGGSFAWCGVS